MEGSVQGFEKAFDKDLKKTGLSSPYYRSTNQSHHCWHRYNEYVLCVKKSDEDACKGLKFAANAICPNEWVELWDDERKEKKFLGVQEKPLASTHH